MVRFRWRRAAMAAGAALLGLLAAGCGKEEGRTTAQKEFVYVPEYHTVEVMDGADQVNVVGDTIYFITGSYNEEQGSYERYLGILAAGESEPKLVPLDLGLDANISGMSMDMEGNLQAVVQTSVPKEGAGSETGDAETSDTEDVSEEGAEEGDGGTAEAGDSATESVEIIGISEGSASTSTSTSTVSYTATAASAVAVPAIPPSDMEGGENPYTQKIEVCKFTTDGTVLSRIDVTSAFEEPDYIYVQYMATDKEGNIYLSVDSNILLLDKDGAKQGEIELDNWINDMFSAKDGTVLVSYHGNNGIEVHPVDWAAKQLGEAMEELIVAEYGNYEFGTGSVSDLLFRVDNELYRFNFGDAAPVEVLKWTDCDIDSNMLSGFAEMEDGRILAITTKYNESGSVLDLIYLTRKKGSEVEEKKLLVYGTLSLGYDVKEQIIEFNKTNQEYRIEIKEYMPDYSEGGYEEAIEQMNADIIGGQCPDIIDLSSGSFQMYAAKGILEDLYPYMDADEEINREDYLENILKAFESDGKLYTLPPTFTINTTIAKVSDVGEKTSITLDELMELMDNMPEGTELYQYASKSTMLMYNIMMSLDQYVDWNTGECQFNSEGFIKALEFANKFESENTYDENEPSVPTKIREGKLLMMNNSISSVQEYQMYQGMFGEPVAFVGFPTTKDNGSVITASSFMVGISAKSAYKEGAWEFVRKSLTKEYQEHEELGDRYGFPVMKSALEAQFARDMEEEYYEDPDGTKQKQPKTTWGYDDFEIEIFAATEEEIAVVRDLIYSVDTLYQYDEQIMGIINEETAAFFEGQKTAKDVADIIQNRVQVYVNENR